MESFFDMGGYAAFIWPAFGLTFVVMAGMVVAKDPLLFQALPDAGSRIRQLFAESAPLDLLFACDVADASTVHVNPLEKTLQSCLVFGEAVLQEFTQLA